jgi:hypothetical protein
MRQKYLDEPFRQTGLFAAFRVQSPVRRSDPETSRWSAQRVTGTLALAQAAVLRVLRAYGPQTDEGILAHLHRPLSPSGCRSRRAELVALGLVRFSGRFGVTAAGNRARIWQAV